MALPRKRSKCEIKSLPLGSGEMAQRLSACNALPGDPDSVPSSQLSVTNSKFKRSDVLSGLRGLQAHTRASQTYIQENTHTQKKEEKSHFSLVSDAHLRPQLFLGADI